MSFVLENTFEEQSISVLRLYNKEYSVNRIAKELDISKDVVSFILRLNGKTVRKSYVTKNTPSESQIAMFAEMYKQGYTLEEIGEQFGFVGNTVKKYLIRSEVYTNTSNLSSDEIEQIKELYGSGLTSREVAKQLGISKTTVLYHIEHTRPTKRDKIYEVDSLFFNKIDTEEKAYWLGLMYADGSVGSTELSITLNLTDEGLVKGFKKSLKAEHPIKHLERSKLNSKWKDSFTLKVNDPQLHVDLIKHGCIPNKTDKVSYPELREDLNRHFIRGLFDGDGSVWGKPGRGYFSITGYLPFLDEVQNIIVKETGLTKTKLQERKPNYGDIRYGGKTPMKQLYDYLYTDARYYLRRKKEKFEEVLPL